MSDLEVEIKVTVNDLIIQFRDNVHFLSQGSSKKIRIEQAVALFRTGAEVIEKMLESQKT
jgi:hypothetical protein